MIEVIRYAAGQVEGLSIERDASVRRVRGLASVYYNGQPGTEYDVMGDGSIMERIMPGAFEGLLASDTIAAVNHDAKMIVGRTPETLRLWTSSIGLEYEITLPNTTAANDLWENVQRGIIRGSSFRAMMDMKSPTSVEWKREEDKDVMMIKRFAVLKDVSPVTDPAYKATDVSAVKRSRDEWNLLVETLARINRMKNLRY